MTRIVVVGAGLSGLSTAYMVEHLARQAGFEVDVRVVEKEQRSGGKILSIREEGYLCEWGPNGFLDNKPATLNLCHDLQISKRLLRSDDNARKRFIFADDELQRLPENGLSFFRSNLISWPGKMRLGFEPFIPRRTDSRDETLADFGRRRLGAEALERLISPMVSGIFAGDPESMSLRSCFPRIHELEQTYGGLVKAMLKLSRQKRADIKAGKAVASAAGPGGVLTSFKGGMQELTSTLASSLSRAPQTGAAVSTIAPKGEGFLLSFADGTQLSAEIVVTAAPAYAVAEMLAGSLPVVSSILGDIPYAAMNVVCFGYEREQIERNLDGFGYLIPHSEGRSILGTLWDSSIFPGYRAPEGKVMLRSMMGGATNPAAVELSDDEIKRLTLADLKQTMGIDCEPEFVRIFRHQQAIPQYTRGHAQRLAAIASSMQGRPDLILSGNSFSGIGLNDCVMASRRAADQVLVRLQARD